MCTIGTRRSVRVSLVVLESLTTRIATCGAHTLPQRLRFTVMRRHVGAHVTPPDHQIMALTMTLDSDPILLVERSIKGGFSFLHYFSSVWVLFQLFENCLGMVWVFGYFSCLGTILALFGHCFNTILGCSPLGVEIS